VVLSSVFSDAKEEDFDADASKASVSECSSKQTDSNLEAITAVDVGAAVVATEEAAANTAVDVGAAAVATE
jgi:hypothetical protein